MGNRQSVDADALAQQYNISPAEVEALLAAFNKGKKKGRKLSICKFKKVVEEVHKIYPDQDMFTPEAAETIFHLLDTERTNKVDPRDFIAGITVLTAGTIEQKAELVFHAIDTDNSGTISRRELTRYVHTTIENAKIKDQGLGLPFRLGLKVAMKAYEGDVAADLIEEAFQADTSGDSYIDLKEWIAAAKNNNKAIVRFLNPAGQIKETVEELRERVEDSGLVVKKEDEHQFYKELLDD